MRTVHRAHRSSCVVAGASLGLALVASPRAWADEPEDHHHLPPEYAELSWPMPPPSAIAPEYPLAAQFIEADSSNFTAGGLGTVQYVVVHTMQGSYEGSINWFLNPDSDVSAHFCMRSEDGEITQMVGLGDRAWHVGSSNTVSVGIEHEGFVDDASWYTFAMYDSSARLARWLADHFGLPLDRDHIVGHVELPDQTHTDPGANWDWDLYMALIQDVVGQGVVEGVVVGGDVACEVVASTDTWLTASLASPDELPGEAKCLVPAGTALRYVYAGPDRVGRRRLELADDAACAIGSGFAEVAAFSEMCPDASLVVPGATVTLDDGSMIATDAEGRFAWADVAAGDHEVGASADGYEANVVGLSHAVYPGTRVVVRLDPIVGDDTTGGEATTGGRDPSDEGEDGGTGQSGGDTTGDAPPASPGSPNAPALPDTFGESETAQGCACAADHGVLPPWWAAAAAFAMAGRRRRRTAVCARPDRSW